LGKERVIWWTLVIIRRGASDLGDIDNRWETNIEDSGGGNGDRCVVQDMEQSTVDEIFTMLETWLRE
jgi:hypothetical protein